MPAHETPAAVAPALTYFDLQATWGLTKHLGGVAATDELLALCHVGRDSLVLEIGCGVGITPTYAVRALGCRVVALDLSRRMLAWAQRRVNRLHVEEQVDLVNANAQELPFADNYFDAVICESVTAFVPDKTQALREYTRVVRPGGFVGLAEGLWLEPPPDELRAYLTRSMNGAVFLALPQWRALLEDAGLTIAAASSYRVSAARQWFSEISRMERADWRQYAQAWKTLSKLVATDAHFREYIRSLAPSSATVFQMFHYFGYGLFVGKKPAIPGGSS